MKKILFDSDTKNVIVTMLIGETYISDWENYIRHTWIAYCEKHGIGLVIIDDIIDTGNFQKPIYWQKLIIAEYLFEQLGFTGNMCFVDSDILINSNAPDIFQDYPETHVALVSQTKNLPYPLDAIRRRLAFFRNRHLSPKYPLDSSLFASNEKVYRLHNLTPQADIACTGVFILNVPNHHKLFRAWFDKYSKNLLALDGGTEEIHLNFEIQSSCKVYWLPYEFQALWIYEMPWKFPFLYQNENLTNYRIVSDCIQSALFTNFFLHFAGRWEGDVWKNEILRSALMFHNQWDELSDYMKRDLKGDPVGVKHPD